MLETRCPSCTESVALKSLGSHLLFHSRFACPDCPLEGDADEIALHMVIDGHSSPGLACLKLTLGPLLQRFQSTNLSLNLQPPMSSEPANPMPTPPTSSIASDTEIDKFSGLKETELADIPTNFQVQKGLTTPTCPSQPEQERSPISDASNLDFSLGLNTTTTGKCHNCGINLWNASPRNMLNHVLSEGHGKFVVGIFECEACEKTYSHKDRFIAHNSRVHNDSAKFRPTVPSTELLSEVQDSFGVESTRILYQLRRLIGDIYQDVNASSLAPENKNEPLGRRSSADLSTAHVTAPMKDQPSSSKNSSKNKNSSATTSLPISRQTESTTLTEKCSFIVAQKGDAEYVPDIQQDVNDILALETEKEPPAKKLFPANMKASSGKVNRDTRNEKSFATLIMVEPEDKECSTYAHQYNNGASVASENQSESLGKISAVNVLKTYKSLKEKAFAAKTNGGHGPQTEITLVTKIRSTNEMRVAESTTSETSSQSCISAKDKGSAMVVSAVAEPDTTKQKPRCRRCDIEVSYKLPWDIVRHVLTIKHGQFDRSFVCSNCGQESVSKESLTNHHYLKGHPGPPRIQCLHPFALLRTEMEVSFGEVGLKALESAKRRLGFTSETEDPGIQIEEFPNHSPEKSDLDSNMATHEPVEDSHGQQSSKFASEMLPTPDRGKNPQKADSPRSSKSQVAAKTYSTTAHKNETQKRDSGSNKSTVCSSCQSVVVYHRVWKLVEHVLSVSHGSPHEEKIKCQLCALTFDSLFKVQKHSRDTHPGEIKVRLPGWVEGELALAFPHLDMGYCLALFRKLKAKLAGNK